MTNRIDENGTDAARHRCYVVSICFLRGGVALQAIGVGLQRLGLGDGWEDESPVFGLLMFDWQWPQQTAQQIDDLGAWLYFVCGLALAVLPVCGASWQKVFGRREPWLPVWLWQTPLCLVVALWQAIQILVAWYRGGFFMSEWTLASESGRLALPVVLLVLTPGPGAIGVSPRRLNVGIWLLRIAAGLTFFAHGLKSYHLNPVFVDYLISAAARISWDVSQSAAEIVLRIIGVLDMTLAVLMVVVRWRTVAFYMATWALIGALARMVQSGWAAHFEVLIRAGNYCVPLIVGLCWQLSRPRRSSHSFNEEKSVDE